MPDADLLFLILGVWIGLLAGLTILWLLAPAFYRAFYRRARRRNELDLELSPEFRAAMQRALRARGKARRDVS